LKLANTALFLIPFVCRVNHRKAEIGDVTATGV
jgi:hypothetical protein